MAWYALCILYAHLCCVFDLGARWYCKTCFYAFSEAYDVWVLRCSWTPCWICCPPSEEQALRASGLFGSCRFSIVNSGSSDFSGNRLLQKRYSLVMSGIYRHRGSKKQAPQEHTKSVAVGGEAAPADLQWARMLGDWQEAWVFHGFPPPYVDDYIESWGVGPGTVKWPMNCHCFANQMPMRWS